MSARLRTVLSVFAGMVLAIVLAFAPSTALAAPPPPPQAGAVAAPAPELRELPTSTAPIITTPRDVPTVGPGEVTIPAVPAGWVTRDLGWLKLSYPPVAAERVEPLLRDAEGIKARFADVLGQDVLNHLEVRITPTFEDMSRLAPIGAPPPGYASGVAYPKLRLVLISMLAPRGAEATDLDQVFRHELAHIALEDAVLGAHVPAWFNEGLAIGLAGENSMDRQKVLWSATVSGKLLPLADLDRGFPSDHFEVNIAYAESASFLEFLMSRTDLARFASMIQRVREGQVFERALGDAYGSDLRKLEFQWRSDVERRYSIIPLLAGGGVIWVGVIGALGYGYVKKKRRAKAILARWAQEEAIEDALLAQRAREAIEAAEGSDTDLARLTMRRAPAKIEHDGNWHTLH